MKIVLAGITTDTMEESGVVRLTRNPFADRCPRPSAAAVDFLLPASAAVAVTAPTLVPADFSRV
jgi:hypothetical protein